MAVTVKKITLWRTEVRNRPGALRDVLAPLAGVGADLQVVMGYHHRDEADSAVVEVSSVSGKKATTAAGKAGLETAAIPTLLVQGDNQPGLGHAIAQGLAAEGINVAFLVAQVIGAQFSAVIGFDDEPAAKQATAIFKKVAKAMAK